MTRLHNFRLRNRRRAGFGLIASLRLLNTPYAIFMVILTILIVFRLPEALKGAKHNVLLKSYQHSSFAHILDYAEISNLPITRLFDRIDDQVPQKEYNQEVTKQTSNHTEAETSVDNAMKSKFEKNKPGSDSMHSEAIETSDSKSALPQKKLITLNEHLNFTSRSALNFMHFHKTGGVSYKTALFSFFKDQKKGNGEPVRVLDACYMRKVMRDGLRPGESWRCDWDPAWEMTPAERSKLDVVFGHQFWKHGAAEILRDRDMRTFTVMRQPFDRKVSFFYHFYIREYGRNQKNVTFDEIRDFLLHNRLRDKTIEVTPDGGPNYMAGRLMSSGLSEYKTEGMHTYYPIAPNNEDNVQRKSLDMIRRYIFIGLQEEYEASMCMLRKTIEVFNKALGIKNGYTYHVASTQRVLNQGSYSLSAAKIWKRFTAEEKLQFEANDKVEHALFKEGLNMFKWQVKLFRCEHLVKNSSLQNLLSRSI